ncbi:MAG: SUMF1/EgtB/PvdO family nonheme iron enzyme [Blastocatellia bacterium]|nr:SUMF1/EgtB/PvdO family nonheme iron enzyme [Blastocatellia bacterium]
MKICPTCNSKFEDYVTFCTKDGEILEEDLESMIGKTLDGQYEIEALLGKGGMGTVYRARHILLGDQVAIKLLPPSLSGNSESLRRFLREGQAARKFHHPNVVTVHDLRNTPEGQIYMVLEYIDGRTLTEELKEHGTFTPAEAVAILSPIASALNAAHAVGVVHRDLKPDNIMLGKNAEGHRIVKLLDLGIAKVKDTKEASLTLSGQILGTPPYMSPEQWGSATKDGGEKIDGRSDIYSLAVVMFELIAGYNPFDGETIQEIATQHVFNPPPLIHEHAQGISESFSRVLARALSKKRADRPSTCQEFIAELETALKDFCTLTEKISQPQNLVTGSLKTKVFAEDPYNTRISVSDPLVTKRAVLELPLSSFDFETVIVNNEGTIINGQGSRAYSFLEDVGNGIMMEMVAIPDGSFIMGSPETELKRLKEEGPQHQVNVSKFLIGRYPVTQAQWKAVSGFPKIYRELNPDPSKFRGDNLPVENVSFDDCEEFCARLSARTGRPYSLPSEAQWEYACRAGTTTAFYYGDTITWEIVNFNGNFRYAAAPKGIYRSSTTAVGEVGFPNLFGLSDMHGNIWEWCGDVWHDAYTDAPNDGTTWFGDTDPSRRVMRGGSWYTNSALCRSATRTASQSSSKSDFVGLRVVISIAWEI